MSDRTNQDAIPAEKAEHARLTALTLLELLRATQSTPLEPERIRIQAERLAAFFRGWLDRQEPLRIGLEKHQLSFNDVVPELDLANFTIAARYADQWKSSGASGLVFLLPVPARELTKILLIPFNPRAKDDLDWLREQVRRFVPETNLQVLPVRRPVLPSFHEVDGRRLLADLAWTLRHAAKQAPRSPEYTAALARLRRLAEELTDFSVQAERLLGLVLLQPPIWPRASVAVQSAMLAVLFGQSLGLSRPLLAELGLCALLSDISGVVQEENGGAPRPPNLLDALPFFVRGPRLDPVLLQGLVLAGDHHRPNPSASQNSPKPHLYSRITAVCRAFVEQIRAGEAPRTALLYVLQNPQGELDLPLARAFAHLLGPVPLGSVVRFSRRPDPGMVCGHWRDRAGRRQPWILDLGPGRKRFKALLTEPATGDEELPRIHGIELPGGDARPNSR